LDTTRRALLKGIGLLPMVISDASGAAEAAKSQVKPRHVLCFLGGEHALAPLSQAAASAIKQFATGFFVDTKYSIDRPDPVMERSFGVCWDRVEPNAWTPADEEAVVNHKSVLYVLSPPMMPDTAVTISTAALFLVEKVISAGHAVAAKGESAGVAHGERRWRELALRAGAALKANDDLALSRACRRAFAKRPLESQEYLESVGFHLVGVPEVYVAKDLGTSMEVVTLMDEVADDLTKRGVDAVLKERKAALAYATGYAEDDFKFNPYGIIHIDRR